MAAQSTLKNMALCLTLVCLFCSAILGVVYAVTYDPIREAAHKALVESVSKVLPEGGTVSDSQPAVAEGVSEYYICSEGDEPIAYAVKSTTGGFGGPLTVMVGVLPDGTVYNTSVLECNETPGLGAKCQSDEGFMSQWKGFNGILKVTKDGGDVDAITASTITSRAYALAVSNAVEFVKSMGGQDNE